MFLGCQPCCNADCPSEGISVLNSPITDVTGGPPVGGWDVTDSDVEKTFYVRRLSGTFTEAPAFGSRGLTFTGCDNFDAWRAGYRYTHATIRYRHRSSTDDLNEQPPFVQSRVAEGAGAAFRLMAHYEHETGDHVFMQMDHALLARGKGRLSQTFQNVDWRYVVDAMTEYTETASTPPTPNTVTITPTGLNSLSTYPRVVVLQLADDQFDLGNNGYVWAAEHTACHWKVGYVVSGVETVVDEWVVYGAGDYVLELGVVGNVCTYSAVKTVALQSGYSGVSSVVYGQSFTAVRGQSAGQVIDRYHINPATEAAAAFIVPEALAAREYGSIGIGARPTQYTPPGGLTRFNFLGTTFSPTQISNDVSPDIVTFPEVTTPVVSSGMGTTTSSMAGNIRTRLFRLPCEPGWEEATVGYVGTTLSADDRASPRRLCRVEVRDRVPGKPTISFWSDNPVLYSTSRLIRYDPHQIGGLLFGGDSPGNSGLGMQCQELASVTLNRRPALFFNAQGQTVNDLDAVVLAWQQGPNIANLEALFNHTLVLSLPATESVPRNPNTYYHYRKDITPASPITYQFSRAFTDNLGNPASTTLDITIEWLYFYWENWRERSVARRTVVETLTSFGTFAQTTVTYIVNKNDRNYPYLNERYFSPVNVYA